ncbi:tRNA threonylcarbamoyl adenosine modification protein, Sua5/YciO/YrdC/YwlC family [Friedmanniella luteola]|uniref:L-threonylcarbamoyladenylate synthase n=1 Tax=Friedmanniella luteola TaxID=546871 RepID=A0A1H1V6T4_9ACTN|nr:L-threonylcarbamoyladenylate synthase [Friedmanniella luteola]SDS80171.1 tRNA threonylcarbamoyl adenosine modification protein, Sua5/YciO/YrdC/YwlC family [Friedmanniella luteola]
MSEAVRPEDPEPSETASSDDAEAASETSEHEFGSDEGDEASYQRFDCTGDTPDGFDEATEAARAAVEAGECIVLPTDTVYGIGADAFSGDAVQRLLDAKMRGRDMPPPVLIADPSLIRALATDVPDTARDLVAAHWPGPLTVICKIQPSLRMDLGENEGTIALRVPDHELAREILRRTGPMAVSSANLSGKPAALTCDDAVDQLGDRVSVYLDGGELSATSGAPSTIVDFTQHEHGEVLRRGALAVELLRATLPDLVDLTEPEPVAEPEPEPALAVEPPPDPEPVVEPDAVEGPAPDDHRAGAHALDLEADERPAAGG